MPTQMFRRRLLAIIGQACFLWLSTEPFHVYDVRADPSENDDLSSRFIDFEKTATNRLITLAKTRVDVPSNDPSGSHAAWEACGGVCAWKKSNSTTVAAPRGRFNGGTLATHPHRPPHIVFVLVDDLGYSDVGYQSSWQRNATPTIDHLANNGVVLTRYYSAWVSPLMLASSLGEYRSTHPFGDLAVLRTREGKFADGP